MESAELEAPADAAPAKRPRGRPRKKVRTPTHCAGTCGADGKGRRFVKDHTRLRVVADGLCCDCWDARNRRPSTGATRRADADRAMRQRYEARVRPGSCTRSSAAAPASACVLYTVHVCSGQGFAASQAGGLDGVVPTLAVEIEEAYRANHARNCGADFVQFNVGNMQPDGSDAVGPSADDVRQRLTDNADAFLDLMQRRLPGQANVLINPTFPCIDASSASGSTAKISKLFLFVDWLRIVLKKIMCSYLWQVHIWMENVANAAYVSYVDSELGSLFRLQTVTINSATFGVAEERKNVSASCIRDDFREILTGKTMKNRYRRMVGAR